MTAKEAYKKFIVKINKNAQTNNISCDRGRFVLIYNESQNKEVEYILEKRNEDDIRRIQKLLVTGDLTEKDTYQAYEHFELLSNYLGHSTLYGLASTDCCKEQVMDMHEIKSENENFVVMDDHDKPHFGFRGAPYYLSEDGIKAFKKDFSYDKLVHTYYRYPVQISLQTPTDPESQFSATDIELDDKIADRIISRAAAEFGMNNNDPKFQIDLQRTINK